jgi:hypothetical protein
MEHPMGVSENRTRQYGSAAGDQALTKWWSPDINLNGQNDPLSLNVILGYREQCRDGDGVRQSMHGKQPVTWKRIIHWLEHVVSGRTTAEATRMGVAEPTERQQSDWEDLNNYALATLDTVSTYLVNFGV